MGSAALKLRDRPASSTVAKFRRFDLFVAAPMAAFESRPAFAASQDRIRRTIHDLIASGTVHQVYYAGNAIGKEEAFGPPDDALDEDLGALAASAKLLLIYPAKLATGALVELGYAMGLRRPAAVLVRAFDDLPYFLRHLRGLHRSPAAGPITVRQYADDHDLTACARAALDELPPV